ncbi:ATP-binding protein [Corallococcus macrosporus]|uniref:histidine kinase n=1 Tax=Corallococcus macrosporus DSM 14697 TaxID=1189310 RepID=A0A250JLF3_9BACT|nr:ATP-binding protein [Corallococcus macrosporus]ATB44714.1 integral membrane sensor signal transduction histidine kinase [Corallococcus macrosporus DSM 14697]
MADSDPQRYRRLLLRSMALPAALALLLAGLLFWQVSALLAANSAAASSDAVLADAVRVRQLLVDRETGVRGFLLTGEPVFLSALAREVAAELARAEPGRDTTFDIAPGMTTRGDARLLRVVLENLLGNAWKFTSQRSGGHIAFFVTSGVGRPRYCVRDNGVGFDMAYAGKLFTPFQRLHQVGEFPGTGIGLATVQRIIHRHGGDLSVEAAPGVGAASCFALEVAQP